MEKNLLFYKELPYAYIRHRADDIIHFHIKEQKEFKLEYAKELLKIIEEYGRGRKFYNLTTFDHVIAGNRELREYSASPEAKKYTIAEAFVSRSLPIQLIGNVYIKLNRPVVPTRFFNNENAAIFWLKQLDQEFKDAAE